ncbi:hypothetical protein CRN84_12825 [Budvicia aquatica]|uniref:Uncharacterized protein n=1 Tax=Budvicia aquatica TaxID=82979 RepID=A0A2C6CU33_9GAMM|nr:hypothetical protein CRN84_12825 [Budvicia aquatica]
MDNRVRRHGDKGYSSAVTGDDIKLIDIRYIKMAVTVKFHVAITLPVINVGAVTMFSKIPSLNDNSRHNYAPYNATLIDITVKNQ